MPKNEKLDTKRHSLAHIMAASVQEMFPEAKFGVGPVIEDGFYYDIHLNRPLTPDDLQAIEKRMRDKVRKNLKFERSELPINSATDMFGKMTQDFKVELLRDLKTRGTTAVADLEEAKKRDHRKLGRELGLFMFHQWAPGAAFWLPKGTTVYNTLANYMRGVLFPAGYVEVKTPLIFNKALWERSGHWKHYRDDMFLIESGDNETM